MSRLPSPIRRALRSLGPVATVPLTESGRAALGAMLGIGIAAFLASAAADGLFLRHFVLMAPFGATATLIFAAPNSPLAQPWPVFVGTLVSALVAVAVSMAVPQTVVAAPLAVALAIFVMALCRATHPPGGAVALMVPLAGPAHADPAWPFLPLAVGTLLLIGIGVLFARATGRRYPFRHVGDANAVGTGDPDPVERTGLSEDELAGILVRYRQSLNLGVEDLARLIAAAEVEAAGNRIGAGTVASIMSRDLVTVAPGTPLDEIAGLFVRHGFTSLPVTQLIAQRIEPTLSLMVLTLIFAAIQAGIYWYARNIALTAAQEATHQARGTDGTVGAGQQADVGRTALLRRLRRDGGRRLGRRLGLRDGGGQAQDGGRRKKGTDHRFTPRCLATWRRR